VISCRFISISFSIIISLSCFLFFCN